MTSLYLGLKDHIGYFVSTQLPFNHWKNFQIMRHKNVHHIEMMSGTSVIDLGSMSRSCHFTVNGGLLHLAQYVGGDIHFCMKNNDLSSQQSQTMCVLKQKKCERSKRSVNGVIQESLYDWSVKMIGQALGVR